MLLVDDDDFIRLLIRENLEQLGYQVDVAQDGQEAWENIAVNPQSYDLVLLDKNMPRMDGITLLKLIKADERLMGLPVVVLTGAAEPENIIEGLAAGAYYYLIKPTTLELLARVINNALEEQRRKRELRNLVGQRQNNLNLLQRAEFSFRTLDEARDLALLLADVSMKPRETILGYSELLINAVEHGNLEISYAKKGQLLEEGHWEEEIENYLRLPAYADRTVKVLLDKRPDAVVVTITDQGNGFDWTKYIEFDAARAFDLNGRGIAMSRNVSFDSLEYHGKGNSVTATVLLRGRSDRINMNRPLQYIGTSNTKH